MPAEPSTRRRRGRPAGRAATEAPAQRAVHGLSAQPGTARALLREHRQRRPDRPLPGPETWPGPAGLARRRRAVRPPGARIGPGAQHHRAAVARHRARPVHGRHRRHPERRAHPELPLPDPDQFGALGLRTGIDSLRRGLMMMGYTQLERWLVGQLPHAGTDLNLQPVRQGMVLRARLMEHILDAGIEEDLRREVYLCGLFSQLDVLMSEPLGSILHRLPLSDRIYSANVTQSGPYLPALDLARAMDSADTATVRALRHAHELDTEDLNRALLHTLLSQHVPANAATRT